MRPNVEFRVYLPKTNPSLAKSHLQRHMATRTKTPPTHVKLGPYQPRFKKIKNFEKGQSFQGSWYEDDHFKS